MSNRFFKVFPVALCLCTLLWGCEKESTGNSNSDTTGSGNDTTTDILSGSMYVWEQGLPSKPGTGFGGWVSDDVYLSNYDTLIHTMDILFVGNMQVNFIESFSANYSSAYRFVAVTDTDDLARIPFLYPENWQQFDTICSYVTKDTMKAHYTGGYPAIIFKLNSTHITINTGSRPNYDYKFWGWDSSFDYAGVFSGQDTLTVSFPYKWNDNIDTITRKFIQKQ